MTREQATAKARQLTRSRSLEQLITDFELTNELAITEDVATVRGWLLDELQDRNKEAFDEWLNSWEDSPRQFFL